MHDNPHDIAPDTIEHAAQVLFYYRFGRLPISGRRRAWTSPLAIFHRAVCRDDAAELARYNLLNPNHPESTEADRVRAATRPRLKRFLATARAAGMVAALLLLSRRLVARSLTKREARGPHTFHAVATFEDSRARHPSNSGRPR